MTDLKEIITELKLNYDTLKYFVNDKEFNITEYFKDELLYSEELTKCLLNLSESYFKSILSRVKLFYGKLDNDKIRNDLLKLDSSLEPLLNKLFTKYELIEDVVEDEEDVKDVKEESVEEEELTLESLLNKFISESVKEDSKKSIKLGDLYDKFSEYCKDNDQEYMDAGEFKKILKNKWGKAKGKKEMQEYEGFSFV
jgi:hypothetical protein